MTDDERKASTNEYVKRRYREDPEFRQKAKDRAAKYLKEHPEINKANSKRYTQKNKEARRAYANARYKRLKEEGNLESYEISRKKYYEKNKERLAPIHNEKSKKYYADNREKILAKSKEDYKYDKEKAKTYYLKNRDRILKHNRQRYKDGKEKQKSDSTSI